MDESLKSIFTGARDPQTVRALLRDTPHVIQGRFSRVGRQAADVWKAVSAQGEVYRWETAQGPRIMILPLYLAQTLLEGSTFPYEDSYFYHDKRKLDRVKAGQLVMGITRKSGVVAVMIREDAAMGLVDRMEQRQQTLRSVVRSLEGSVPGRSVKVIVTDKGVEIEMQDPPAAPPAGESPAP